MIDPPWQFGGAPDYGRHWQALAQAQGYPFGQSGMGALGAAPSLAQYAQQASIAQQAAYYQALANAQQGALAAAIARPEPIEDAGISAGEIVGHRAWFVVPSSGILQSMAATAAWAPGEPMHGDVRNYLGVHAFKHKAAVLTEYALKGCGALPVAIGTVALWGEVIEHERGYRAEFASVLSVDMVCGIACWRERRLIKRIRARYQL